MPRDDPRPHGRSGTDGPAAWRVRVSVLVVPAAATAAGVVVPLARLGATVVGLAYSVSMVARDLLARRFGTDVLATIALTGTLLVGAQPRNTSCTRLSHRWWAAGPASPR